MLTYTPKPGQDIEAITKAAAALATKSKDLVQFDYKGARVNARPGTSPECLRILWDVEMLRNEAQSRSERRWAKKQKKEGAKTE